MIECTKLAEIFKANKFTFFAGLPDSTFKAWMSFLDERGEEGLTHRIAAIERDAVAWAAGYHVATGNTGVVYMQNSGLGNTINPLTSLTSPEVYDIPLLLMVGWRGEPGKKDEPQHVQMGKITLPQLDVLGIKYKLLPGEMGEIEKVIAEAREHIDSTGESFALVVRKGLFEKYTGQSNIKQSYDMKREDAIKIVLDALQPMDVVVSTTGKASREIFEYREKLGQGHEKDFLMVGSMGCVSSMAGEIALQKPDRKIYALDGDGAIIMGMGSLSTIGHYKPKNLMHVVFDNGAYESTGGQPTTADNVNFEQLAVANGYAGSRTVETSVDLRTAMADLTSQEGPYMLIVKVEKGARADLGRPTTTPVENKKAFMNNLK